MKYKILFTAFCFSSAFAFCQDTLTRSQIEFYENFKETKKLNWLAAAELGGNASTIAGQSESYSGFRFGFNFAIYLPIVLLPNKIEINGGLGYSQQGSGYKAYRYVPGGGESSSKAKVALDYVNVPLTARYNFKSGVYAEAGLQPAYLLSAKDKNNGSSEDIKDDYKKFDLGLIASVGYQVNKHVGVGVKVIPGLMNINKSNSTYEKVKDRNLVFSLRGAYRF